MSLRARGAITTSMFLPALLHDLGFDLRDKSANRLLALQGDSLSLIDFIEPLFGCLTKRFQLRCSFVLLLF